MTHKKTVITGAAGCIGSSIAKYLHSQGSEVVLVDNLSHGYLDNLSENRQLLDNLYVMDVSDPRFDGLCNGADTIIHLAGISSLPECQSNPNLAIHSNITSSAHVFESARKHNVRLTIFASTSAVYENSTNEDNLDEDSEIIPDLIYSWSKRTAEQLAQSYVENFGLNVVICRFFNVYGPHQDFRRPNPPFTSYLIKELIQGRVPIIFNTGPSKRDYVYVDDLIDCIDKIRLTKLNITGEIFNVCSGIGYTALEILDIASKACNQNTAFNVGDPNRFWSSYPNLLIGNAFSQNRILQEINKTAIGNRDKSLRLLSWMPKTGLDEGIRNIVNYQQSEI